MKVLTINRVRVGSLAKVVGVVQAVFAFVYGLGLTLAVASNSVNEGTGFVKSLGLSLFVLGMAVVFFPLVGYVVGWVQGALAAVVLNFIFAESKGLELEVDL